MNRHIVIGNVVTDVDVKDKDFGKIAKFRIAVDRGYTDETDFFDVVAFGSIAEIAGLYVSKGKCVAIEGRGQARNYEKDGIKHRSYEIVVNNLEFL